MKYVIEKNTVSETLVIPLYARKMCSECFPNIYRDETALRLIDKVDYDFASLSEKSKGITYRFGFSRGCYAAKGYCMGGVRLP